MGRVKERESGSSRLWSCKAAISTGGDYHHVVHPALENWQEVTERRRAEVQGWDWLVEQGGKLDGKEQHSWEEAQVTLRWAGRWMQRMDTADSRMRELPGKLTWGRWKG